MTGSEIFSFVVDSAEIDDRVKQAMEKAPQGDEAHVDDGVLIRYRNAEVPSADAENIEKHLAGCGECRELLLALSTPISRAQQDRASGLFVSRRGARWWIAAVGSIAAGVAAIVLLSPWRAEDRLPAYTLDGPHGFVKVQRSGGAQTDHLAREGVLRMSLIPGHAHDAPVAAAIFEAKEGRLRRLPASIREENEVFEIQLPGRAAFGEELGDKRIAVVIAQSEDALARLQGASIDQLEPMRHWTFELVYSEGPPR